MLAIYCWLFAGFIILMIELYQNLFSNWSHGAEAMIKDTVIMLASLELIRTLQSYLQLGRVKVTFIIDVALVVLIGELISLWYVDYEIAEILVNLGVISVLMLLRIVTIKYSPDYNEEARANLL